MAKPKEIERVNDLIQEDAASQNLDLRDKINDMDSGLQMWQDVKDALGEWTAADEMLLRWMKANQDNYPI